MAKYPFPACLPLRSIQQYEQGQKELSHARADVVVRLSKAMYCRIEDIIWIDDHHQFFRYDDGVNPIIFTNVRLK